MALFCPPHLTSSFSSKPLVPKPCSFTLSRKHLSLLLPKVTHNGGGVVSSTSVVIDEKLSNNNESNPPLSDDDTVKKEELLGSNGQAAAAAASSATGLKFEDPRWVGGTWDLKQFTDQDGKTLWDSLIDAEARRRKWLEDNPESSSNDEPVLFNSSIIPWWVWVRRFHLPEAELLNGRAAMIGFFMAYLVDSLTGVGLVDQTGNFFCKTLLFAAVVGVLVIRKNEDLEKLKRLVEETTLYDKQWQATWQDDSPSTTKKN